MRKILVPILGVPDPECTPKLTADGQQLDTGAAKILLNPFCEIALSKALDLKEGGSSVEVVAVTVGPPERVEQLRSALALGADRAIHVETRASLAAHILAIALKAVVIAESPDLVLGGKQAVDSDRNEVLQRLAALLDWPQACFASKIALGDGVVTVSCEVDVGRETVICDLPAVITADLRLVERTRFASLPGIMKARKKPVQQFSLEQLGVDVAPRVNVLRFEMLPGRSPVQLLPDVTALVTILQKQGVL